MCGRELRLELVLAISFGATTLSICAARRAFTARSRSALPTGPSLDRNLGDPTPLATLSGVYSTLFASLSASRFIFSCRPGT